MPIQSLPREVVRIVVGFLSCKKDLSSISLVSTYFLALVRPNLFSSIRLPKVVESHDFTDILSVTGDIDDSNPRDYKDFVSFLISHPELALFIRHLTLWERPQNPWYTPYVDLGPLSLELLNTIISELPSLCSLELQGVRFTTSDTAVPYRHESIDRLMISHPGISENRPSNTMKPLCLFSRVHELSLFSFCAWPDVTVSIKQRLEEFRISNILSRDLQVFNIHLSGHEWGFEFLTEIFRLTATPNVLRSFSIHCDYLTTDCHASSTVFDLLREAAPTLTHMSLGASHFSRYDIQTLQYVDDEQSAYHQFDSPAMRTRLAPLTSLRSLTLNFQFYEPDRLSSSFCSPSEAFLRTVPLLAAFPPCLRRIVFSFAKPPPFLMPTLCLPYGYPQGGSWLWPELDLRALVPLLRRYEELEVVVFEGAEGTTVEEKERILGDLPEFKDMIRFVE